MGELSLTVDNGGSHRLIAIGFKDVSREAVLIVRYPQRRTFGDHKSKDEPLRESRRLVGLSQAAMAA
jgi:hypothetical protein